jgi:FtsH-binding integral membrane protein
MGKLRSVARVGSWILVGVSIVGAIYFGGEDWAGTVFFLGNAGLMTMVATTPEDGERLWSARGVTTLVFGVVMLIGMVRWMDAA